MAANLFVPIPSSHPGAERDFVTGSLESVGWAIAHGAATLAVRSVLGLLLVLGAVGLVAQTIRFETRLLVVFVMALLFGLATGCYALLLCLVPPDPAGASTL